MVNGSHDSCGQCSGRALPGAGDEIGRRTFLAQSALLAAAAALAACGGAVDATAPDLTGQVSIKVTDYPTLSSVGGIALVTIQGSPLAIVRTGTSTYVALSRICPHAGSTVNQSGSGFLCPNHGAQFSADGTWVGGQRTSNLRSYATSYDAASSTLTIG